MTALHIHARDPEEALRIACDRALDREWVHLCPDGWVDIDDERTSPVAPVLGSRIIVPAQTVVHCTGHRGDQWPETTAEPQQVLIDILDPAGERVGWWMDGVLCWCWVADLARKAD